LFVGCDNSLSPDTGPSVNSERRIETVRQWYDSALIEQQKNPPRLPNEFTQIDSDSIAVEILGAMVRKYPPDWDNMKIWDYGTDGYLAATLLEGKSMSEYNPDISVIRSLIVKINNNGKRVSGQLIEFIGLGLDASLLWKYVDQWLVGNFEDHPMIVAEYTVAYASVKTLLYIPNSEPKRIKMVLQANLGSGKNCYSYWVTDIDYDYICRVEHDLIDGNSCLPFLNRLEITCASEFCPTPGMGGYSGGGTGDGNSGGSGGGQEDSGGGNGSGDNGDPDMNEVGECDCSDQKICDIIGEYEEMRLASKPSCIEFISGAGTKNFSWREFMGNWGNGTEYGAHKPYGIMVANVSSKVQQLRD